MGLLSLTISYFNKFANGESLWAPFLEMFKILSVILILTYIATKSKSFSQRSSGKLQRIDCDDIRIAWRTICGNTRRSDIRHLETEYGRPHRSGMLRFNNYGWNHWKCGSCMERRQVFKII